MSPKKLLIFLIIALFAIAITGCGGDDNGDDPTDNNPALSEEQDPNGEQTEDSGAASGGTKLSLVANPDGELKYNTTKLNSKPGNITIALTNDSTTPHDVAVRDSSEEQIGQSETITKSDTTLELDDVAAGSYTFFCSLPGHEAAGMKGTLTVR